MQSPTYNIEISKKVSNTELIFLNQICRVLNKNTRQRSLFCRVYVFPVCCIDRHTAKMGLCRVSICLPCAQHLAHGKDHICRVPECLPCVTLQAHGKQHVCRVPDIVHTVKVLAHGKQRVSGSVVHMSGTTLYGPIIQPYPSQTMLSPS